LDSVGELRSAYSRLVGSERDIQGFVAFAQFFAARAAVGESAPASATFALSTAELDVYRKSAFQDLENYRQQAIEVATPDLFEEARDQHLESMRLDLVNEIRRGSDWRVSIATGVAAWLLSIAITVLVVSAVELPALIEVLARIAAD
jgi:hypothetical protein